MIHYSVFSQSQPVKWYKMLRFCVFLRVTHVAFCARSAQKIFRGFQGLTRFWYHFRAKREENCWRFQGQNEVFITWQCFLAVTFWGSRKVSALSYHFYCSKQPQTLHYKLKMIRFLFDCSVFPRFKCTWTPPFVCRLEFWTVWVKPSVNGSWVGAHSVGWWYFSHSRL